VLVPKSKLEEHAEEARRAAGEKSRHEMTFEPHVPEISAVIQLVRRAGIPADAIGTSLPRSNIRLGRPSTGAVSSKECWRA